MLLHLSRFETGDLSEWDSYTEEGSSTVTANATSKRSGSYGLEVVASNDDDAYVTENDAFSDQTEVFSRIYVNFNSVSLGTGEAIGLYYARNDALTEVPFYLALLENSGTTYLLLGILKDDDSYDYSIVWACSSIIDQAWHEIKIHWKAGTGADGGAELWVDGTSRGSVFTLDCNDGRVGSHLIGAYQVGANSSITVYYDDIRIYDSISLVWTSNNSGGSTVNYITLTKPSDVETNDLLILIVGSDDSNGGDWQDISGWTKIINYANTNADASMGVYWRIATGSEDATINVYQNSGNNDEMFGWYIRIRGVNTSSPINIVGTPDYTTSGANHTIDAVNTDVDNCLAFYVLSFDGGDGAPFNESDSGWSEEDEETSGTGSTDACGCWGIKEMPIQGSTLNVVVASTASDGAVYVQFAIELAVAENEFVYTGDIDMTLIPSYLSKMNYPYSGSIPITMIPDYSSKLEAVYSGILPMTILPSYQSSFEKPYNGNIPIGIAPSYLSKCEMIYDGVIPLSLLPAYSSKGEMLYAGDILMALSPSYVSVLDRIYAGSIPVLITPSADSLKEYPGYNGNIPLVILPASEYGLSVIYQYDGAVPIALVPSYSSILDAVYDGDIQISLLPSYSSKGEMLYSGDIPIVLSPSYISSAEKSYSGVVPIILTPNSSYSLEALNEFLYQGNIPIVLSTTSNYLKEYPSYDGSILIMIVPASDYLFTLSHIKTEIIRLESIRTISVSDNSLRTILFEGESKRTEIVSLKSIIETEEI